ncbi:MAG: exodeoxyribonuclease VII large subunit [Bacteroidales bacterium]
MENKSLGLSELILKIKGVISDKFFETYWILAEIGDIKYNRNGHAYLELIEKDKKSERITAKANATIWNYTLRMLKPYFETTSGIELTAGIKILISVAVEFHELYGFSLNIRDIDPAYTLGDIEKKRLEIIERLENEGVAGMNKEIELPVVCQRIAVISSETAAGYQDFIKQLAGNNFGYVFYTSLFPALMQGDQTESTIISALDRVFESNQNFDCVVIIRGGGSRADLMWFDNYNLAYYITQFPLPVIAGIGHEKDFSIVDMVSHTSLKTPTAVAEFFISKAAEFENRLDWIFGSVAEIASGFCINQTEKLQDLSQNLNANVQKTIYNESSRIRLSAQKLLFFTKTLQSKSKDNLKHLVTDLDYTIRNRFKSDKKDIRQFTIKLLSFQKIQIRRHRMKLGYLENSIGHFDPKNVLKKGYSITRHKGKVLKNKELVKKGDTIETTLYNGTISSTIEESGTEN